MTVVSGGGELLPVCNGCDAIAPEADDNAMGYCSSCLASSVAQTARAYEAEFAAATTDEARAATKARYDESIHELIHGVNRPRPPQRHSFNPEEVDIGVGIQRGYTCLDRGKTEAAGDHG